MRVLHPIAQHTGFSYAKAEEPLIPEHQINNNQPEQQVIDLNQKQIGDWMALSLLVTGGVLTIGWIGVLGWGLWKLVAFVVF